MYRQGEHRGSQAACTCRENIGEVRLRVSAGENIGEVRLRVSAGENIGEVRLCVPAGRT